jgi:hypothetical protein
MVMFSHVGVFVIEYRPFLLLGHWKLCYFTWIPLANCFFLLGLKLIEVISCCLVDIWNVLTVFES